MKKVSFSILALTTLATSMLIGCASSQFSPKSQATAALPKPKNTTVSPAAYPGDPVGYATVVLGSPGDEQTSGRFFWKTDGSRFDEIRQAMESWCKHYGGKHPPSVVFVPCTDGQGKTLTRYTVAFYIKDRITVMVEAPSLAEKEELEKRLALASHKRYMDSNGAKGSITLVNGQSYEVLRFGSANAPIDYEISTVDGKHDRQLRDVVSIRRLSPAGERTSGNFEFRFADGTTSRDKHRLSNSYHSVLPNGIIGSTQIAFGRVSSPHMLLVVRSNQQASPRQVRIAMRDIDALQIDSIDTRPRSHITIESSDAKLYAALMARWTRAASNQPIQAFRDGYVGPVWCSKVSLETIEVSIVCNQLWAEHEIARRSGVYTPSTTPATLADENFNALNDRTLM
jgi:hypothetical protein